MDDEVPILRAWTYLTHLHDKKARLELGRQLTLLQGSEPANLWEGDAESVANAAIYQAALLPFLHYLYGKDHYTRLLDARIESKTILVDLPYTGLKRPQPTSLTFEWLAGQSPSQASISVKVWSMAALRFRGVRAALNIVSSPKLLFGTHD